MPFGKYQGRLPTCPATTWPGLPARLPKGELGRLLALMHEIDHNGLNALLEPLRQGRR